MATTRQGLTADEVARFHREGFLVVEDALAPAELEPVRREIAAEVTARARRLVESGALSRIYEEEGFERQLAKITVETDEVARSIWNGVLYGPEIFRLITHPAIVDIAASLVGTEIIASSVYRLRPKVPGYGYGEVPWHQDSGYFDPYCDAHLVVTMWLPLVPATPANGCLHVMRGRHNDGIFRHRLDSHGWYLEIPSEELPEGEVVPAPVPLGGVLLMTNRTPHVSFANTSDTVRWSMDLRYQSATLPTNAPISRTAEERRALEEPGVPRACYPPEADFLVRSQTRPDEVITDPEAFARLRREHESPPFHDRWTSAVEAVDWSRRARDLDRRG